MVTLLQGAILALLAVITYLAVGVFHASWAAALGAGVLLQIALWGAFGLWHSRRPNWRAPWDEGLQQGAHMANVFVPVAITYLLFMLVVPPILEEGQRARQRRDQQRQQAPRPSPP